MAVRVAIAMLPYSGHATPPRYGDFEAQRHWMEVTVNLPARDWYRETADNELGYWGLDYPPLTAFVSQWFGMLAREVVPDLVALHESRGHESFSGKLFMRGSVLLCDLLVYWVSVYHLATTLLHKRLEDPHSLTTATKPASPSLTVAAFRAGVILALFAPPLLLIDHGHFQYNCVCLGLCALAVSLIERRRPICGSAIFCLALNFKHMAAYFAPVFFCHLLRRSWESAYGVVTIRQSQHQQHQQEHQSNQPDQPNQINIARFVLAVFLRILPLACAVLGTFAMLWWPFDPLELLGRLVPVARGVFEDKVANFWCTLSVIIKVQHVLSKEALFLACFAATLLSILPSCANVLLRPSSPERFLLALGNTAMGFFLFSFQVHEKSVLFPMLPLLLATPLFPSHRGFVVWMLAVCSFSMYPLLIRDGHGLSYLVLQLLLLRLFFPWRRSDLLHSVYKLMLLLMALVNILGLLFSPPPHLPDLLAVAISALSFFQFSVAWVMTHTLQFSL
ncbi:MAG: hypothetical protein Q8P67_09450 [archaeon]|nr:hypothetical protein [archaeon]